MKLRSLPQSFWQQVVQHGKQSEPRDARQLSLKLKQWLLLLTFSSLSVAAERRKSSLTWSSLQHLATLAWTGEPD